MFSALVAMRLHVGSAGRAPGEQRRERGHRARLRLPGLCRAGGFSHCPCARSRAAHPPICVGGNALMLSALVAMRLHVGSAGRAPGEQRRDRGLRARLRLSGLCLVG
eukprot:5899053-Pyramimonas_sp.AAC.1